MGKDSFLFGRNPAVFLKDSLNGNSIKRNEKRNAQPRKGDNKSDMCDNAISYYQYSHRDIWEIRALWDVFGGFV
jgi:hypothetical protein